PAPTAVPITPPVSPTVPALVPSPAPPAPTATVVPTVDPAVIPALQTIPPNAVPSGSQEIIFVGLPPQIGFESLLRREPLLSDTPTFVPGTGAPSNYVPTSTDEHFWPWMQELTPSSNTSAPSSQDSRFWPWIQELTPGQPTPVASSAGAATQHFE